MKTNKGATFAEILMIIAVIAATVYLLMNPAPNLSPTPITTVEDIAREEKIEKARQEQKVPEKKITAECETLGGQITSDRDIFDQMYYYCFAGVKSYFHNSDSPTEHLEETTNSKRCAKYADFLAKDIPIKDAKVCTDYFN